MIEVPVGIPTNEQRLFNQDKLLQDDELVEVTPKSIRLRKTFLDPNERKRAERSKAAEVV